MRVRTARLKPHARGRRAIRNRLQWFVKVESGKDQFFGMAALQKQIELLRSASEEKRDFASLQDLHRYSYFLPEADKTQALGDNTLPISCFWGG